MVRAATRSQRVLVPTASPGHPVDPTLSPTFALTPGLPNENPGCCIIEGTLRQPENVTVVRPALPLDGNPGGWPDYLVENAGEAVERTRVGGGNAPWTQQPGDWQR